MPRADRVLTTPFLLAVLVIFGVALAIGLLLPVLPLYAKWGSPLPRPARRRFSCSLSPGGWATGADAGSS
jgi:hypothetical protein